MVTCLDTKTGKYVAKSKMERKVTSANESDYLSVILPSLTQVNSKVLKVALFFWDTQVY